MTCVSFDKISRRHPLDIVSFSLNLISGVSAMTRVLLIIVYIHVVTDILRLLGSIEFVKDIGRGEWSVTLDQGVLIVVHVYCSITII